MIVIVLSQAKLLEQVLYVTKTLVLIYAPLARVQTDRQTDRQTDTDTDRQTDRQTDRDRDRKRQTVRPTETETDRYTDRQTQMIAIVSPQAKLL